MPTSDKSNTNLASTYHVLSALHRLGHDARLTLGKARTVGVVVVNEDGRNVDVEVKGLAGKNPWPVDNVGPSRADLFCALVCFGGTMQEVGMTPEVWAIPSTALSPFVYHAPGGRKVVQYTSLARDGQRFRGAWHLIAGGQ